MLRLTTADVELFGAASGDVNPLHLSPAYARATAFGGPIAHGVLGAIAAATKLPDRPGGVLRRIALEFPRPIALELDHQVEVVADGADACSLEVRDGSRPVVRGVLEFGRAAPVAVHSPDATTLREVAARHEGLARGHAVTGAYGPDLRALLRRFPIGGKGISQAQAQALALCSYVIGMELPGELALFTRLVLEFHDGPRDGPLSFEATVESWQARTGALRVGVDLRIAGEPWARASLRAFVRADPAPEELAPIPTTLDPQAFAGQTALVIGASRGLGRSLARAFAAHGGAVLAVARSPVDAEALGRGLPAGAGSIATLQVDAGDPNALARALEQVERLDVLVCNASPPLQPMVLEAATAERVHQHISQAVAMVSAPVCVCAPRLAASGGIALLSSSQAVVEPPAQWAHYVAAKRAAEALFEVAALQYPEVGFVIARMPRLDTAFALNVSGELTACPRMIAAQLIERLAGTRPARGRVELMTGATTWARRGPARE